MVVTVSVELSMIAAPKWHCWISAITPSVRVHIAHIVLFEHFSFFLYSKQHGRHCSCLVTLCPPSSSTSRMVHSLATPSSQVKGTEWGMLEASRGDIGNHDDAHFVCHHSFLKSCFFSRDVQFSVFSTDHFCCSSAVQQENVIFDSFSLQQNCLFGKKYKRLEKFWS